MDNTEYTNKIRCRSAMARARRNGTIIAPDVCSDGGSPGRIEGHHHKGYDEAHHLDIQWLCLSCHRTIHDKIRRDRRTALLKENPCIKSEHNHYLLLVKAMAKAAMTGESNDSKTIHPKTRTVRP